ncbi:MAG: TlpA family protein disulfide reductase [Candidatus Dormibacteria bacterium]
MTLLLRRWPCAVLLLIVLVLAGCGQTGPASAVRQGRGAAVGMAAPGFTLQGLDGRQHSLAEYRGHVVLVNFWATWCIPCRAEIPELQVTYRRHLAEGVVILGLDWKEGRDAVQPFVDERQVTYPVLLDAGGQAYTAYQVPALPQTFVLDRQGRVVVVRTGLATRDRFEQELKSAGA